MTDSPPPGEVTQLLLDWSKGDASALDRLIPLVYAELRRLAGAYMRKENAGHTLQTTALVNEAYLRLVNQRRVRWQNRAQFFGIAAQLMRRILIDHARRHKRAKRGGYQISFDEAVIVSPGKSDELVALDEALMELARIDPRKARHVELRFFGGLSVEDAAAVLELSPVTIMREWKSAKAWLHRALNQSL